MNANLLERGCQSGKGLAHSKALGAPGALGSRRQCESGVALRLPPHSIWVLRLLVVAGLLLSCWQFAHATTNDPTTVLQKGLFEEEANHDLDAAISAYRSVIAQFDQDRKLAATAVFRLGECYRKQGKTNEANAQYERVLREFADQAPLVSLSRSYLAAGGLSRPGETAGAAPVPATSAEAEEVKRIQAMIQDSPDLINAPSRGNKTPLEDAAAKGQLVVAQFLLKSGANVNAKGSSGYTPLHDAVVGGHKSMVELLLNSGAALEAKTAAGETALHLAATSGFKNVAEVLLGHKADVNARDNRNETPLHKAAAAGHLPIVQMLVSAGAEVNIKNLSRTPGSYLPLKTWNATPLAQAVVSEHIAVAEFLLNHKADPNETCGAGVGSGPSSLTSPNATQNASLLYFAVLSQSRDLAALLLKHGANADAGTPGSPPYSTPLVRAIQDGDKDLVSLLLASHADPNLVTETGETALFYAVEKGSKELAELLLTNKAEVNFRKLGGEKASWTPLVFAVNDHKVEMAALLLKYKADPNTTSDWRLNSEVKKGYTPLLLASYLGQADMVEVLVNLGANPNLASNEGVVPLQTIGSIRDRKRIAVALLDHGAAVDPRDREERTPLMLEAASGRKEVVELLLAQKADPNARDTSGNSPLHYLARYSGDGDVKDKPAIVSLLLKAGADVNALANNGITPLQLVAKGTSPSQVEMAALLRQHGGVEHMPDFTSVGVTRKGLDNPIVVFHKDTNGLNGFTLLEVLGNYYADPGAGSRAVPRPGLPTPPPFGGGVTPGILMAYGSPEAFSFPDLSNLRIHRPVSGKPNEEQIIPVILPSGTNAIDCARDVRLQFGDVVEIPEREHSLAEPRIGLNSYQKQALDKCLQRKVTFVAKAERVTITSDGKGESYLSRALRSPEVQAILRSTSDFTRVNVTRPQPGGAQPKSITENIRPFWDGQEPIINDLWLRDGDVVEVPDK